MAIESCASYVSLKIGSLKLSLICSENGVELHHPYQTNSELISENRSSQKESN